MKPLMKCLCGQMVKNTSGWLFVHQMAHVRRGEAKRIEGTTQFEWLTKKPKRITLRGNLEKGLCRKQE